MDFLIPGDKCQFIEHHTSEASLDGRMWQASHHPPLCTWHSHQWLHWTAGFGCTTWLELHALPPLSHHFCIDPGSTKALGELLHSGLTSNILGLWVPSRKLCADAYTIFHAPSDILGLWAPSRQHRADAYAKSPILIFTIWHTFLYLSICYPESLIIYLILCSYHMLHWATNISLHGSYLILPSLLRSGLISDTYLSSKLRSR